MFPYETVTRSALFVKAIRRVGRQSPAASGYRRLESSTEREFRDLHNSINYRFERVNARLETIEARIEAFGHRMDNRASSTPANDNTPPLDTSTTTTASSTQ
jgi:hypothetical protein